MLNQDLGCATATPPHTSNTPTEYDDTMTDCFAGQPFACSYITGCC